MAKITFIGAGSMVFAKNLIGDILSFEALEDSTLALMDIDEQRLAQTTAVAEALVENGDVGATIESTTDRREALEGADYVLNMINVGGTEPFENEIRIPERYGVEQAIGDTLGPGGIFRGLRTIPTMLEIAADMEAVCPDALLLNYTNPMAIVCWVMFEATDIETVGLCHSVPHTVDAIAEYIDVPSDELEYWVAGINHMAWFLECTWQGEDVYPQLQEALKDEAPTRKIPFASNSWTTSARLSRNRAITTRSITRISARTANQSSSWRGRTTPGGCRLRRISRAGWNAPKSETMHMPNSTLRTFQSNARRSMPRD